MKNPYNFSLSIRVRELEEKVLRLEKRVSRAKPTRPVVAAAPLTPHGKSGPMLTLKQFLDAYSIGRTTAFSEMANGSLKARRSGNRLLISPEDAEAWLAGRTKAR